MIEFIVIVLTVILATVSSIYFVEKGKYSFEEKILYNEPNMRKDLIHPGYTLYASRDKYRDWRGYSFGYNEPVYFYFINIYELKKLERVKIVIINRYGDKSGDYWCDVTSEWSYDTQWVKFRYEREVPHKNGTKIETQEIILKRVENSDFNTSKLCFENIVENKKEVRIDSFSKNAIKEEYSIFEINESSAKLNGMSFKNFYIIGINGEEDI